MLDQRRLAAARVADDAQKFAAIDRERHILHRTAAKGRTLPVGVRQVFYTNDLFQGYSPLR